MNLFRMISIFLGVVLMGPGTFAASGGGKSEFFFQPDGGKHSLTGLIESLSGKIKYDPQNADFSVLAYYLEYLYGLTADQALGIRWGYGASEITSDNSTRKSKSLLDLDLIYKGNTVISSVVLRYGANFLVGLKKHKEATETEDGDLSSGGMGFAPYLGVEYPLSFGSVGLTMKYRHNLGQTIDNGEGNPETKVTGDHKTTLFPYVEVDYGTGKICLAYSHQTNSPRISETVGTPETKYEAYNTGAIILLGTYNMSSDHAFLAQVESAESKDFAGTEGAKYNHTDFMIGYRASF